MQAFHRPVRRGIFPSLHGVSSVLAGVVLAAALVAASPDGACSSPGMRSNVGRAVVWCPPKDPYRPLAEEMARTERLPLASTLDDALRRRPAYLLWVVAPQSLSEQEFSRFGRALLRDGRTVSTGVISGSTLDKARELWKRQPAAPDRCLSIVPREERIEILEDGQVTRHPPDLKSILSQFRRVGYVMYQGHGTRRLWQVHGDEELTAANLPGLPRLVAAAGACQTFKLWSEDSIALAFTDRGAAAYIGSLHSPFGGLIGDPKGFPFRHTWRDFPIGHAVQVQNRGLCKGSIAWPYYMLLGDPRLYVQTDEPYTVKSDRTAGTTRTLVLAEAVDGVIPIRIPGGAAYDFVEIPGLTRAGMRDVFYNARLQMADIGDDKFLLAVQQGGDVTVRLRRHPPLGWAVRSAVPAALDHVTAICHSEGSIVPTWALAVIATIAVAAVCFRKKVAFRRSMPEAFAVGSILTAFRAGYAMLRQARIAESYETQLRTMDLGFDISLSVLLAMFFLSTCGAWLYFNSRSRAGRFGSLLIVVFPTWAIMLLWTGMTALTNLLGRRYVGSDIYGYGTALAAGVALAVECLVVAIAIMAGRQIARRRASASSG